MAGVIAHDIDKLLPILTLLLDLPCVPEDRYHRAGQRGRPHYDFKDQEHDHQSGARPARITSMVSATAHFRGHINDSHRQVVPHIGWNFGLYANPAERDGNKNVEDPRSSGPDSHLPHRQQRRKSTLPRDVPHLPNRGGKSKSGSDSGHLLTEITYLCPEGVPGLLAGTGFRHGSSVFTRVKRPSWLRASANQLVGPTVRLARRSPKRRPHPDPL